MKKLFFFLLLSTALFSSYASAQGSGTTYLSKQFSSKKRNPFTKEFVASSQGAATSNYVTVSDLSVRFFCASCNGNAAYQFDFVNELPRTSVQGDYTFYYYKAQIKDTQEEVTVSLCFGLGKLKDVTITDEQNVIILGSLEKLN